MRPDYRFGFRESIIQQVKTRKKNNKWIQRLETKKKKTNKQTKPSKLLKKGGYFNLAPLIQYANGLIPIGIYIGHPTGQCCCPIGIGSLQEKNFLFFF